MSIFTTNASNTKSREKEERAQCWETRGGGGGGGKEIKDWQAI